MKIYESDCYGCEACLQACPRQAIQMVPGEAGALYPQVKEALCVECGLCQRVCPDRHKHFHPTTAEAYAAVCQDKALRANAASGGAFSALADQVLAQGGVVFGAAMPQQGFAPQHIMVEEREALWELQGSKYAQSRIGSTYAQVEAALKAGRVVLFSGTPCQVDGLYGYLGGREWENLYTADLICHGVPSGKLLEDAMEVLAGKKRKITGFTFRCNEDGWGKMRYRLQYVDPRGNRREVRRPADRFSYYWLFLKGVIYRDNCYRCPYASLERVGDVTLGDWWGIEQEYPQYLGNGEDAIPIGQGVSCLLVNSAQGQKLLNRYGALLKCLPTQAEAAARHNAQLRQPQTVPEDRRQILALYRQQGYPGVERWYRKQLGAKWWLRQLKDRLGR